MIKWIIGLFKRRPKLEDGVIHKYESGTVHPKEFYFGSKAGEDMTGMYEPIPLDHKAGKS